MNFSVDSLKHVNEYLEIVRNNENIQDHWNVVVLRAGAYVGEVIRQNDKNTSWVWVNYEDARKIDIEVDGYGISIATAAVLYDGEKGFIFPLAKVEKYLKNGKESDVHFFAEVLLATKR